jgi:Mg2+/Co2+ transporter CorB
MVTLNADEPLGSLLTQVLESPFTRLPLWKNTSDNIVGIVHAKSLLQEMQAHAGRVEDIDIMTIATDPWFVPDTTNLSDQLQAFRQRREHFALVVDEYGTLMGMLTLEDILEEIVGDIDDELDDVVAGVRKQNNGTYVVDGTVTIRDLNREFEWNLPDQDYTTIAGLILYESHMVPEPGQSFTFFGFRFDVVKRLRNQITQVRVTPPARAMESEKE